MHEDLDLRYLEWIHSEVEPNWLRSPKKTYTRLLETLYGIEFVWSVPNDGNRLEDGRALRGEFLDIFSIAPDRSWLSRPCSMLEMLVALSRRIAFETGIENHDWFWTLLDNMDITFPDNGWKFRTFYTVQDRVKDVIYREYHPNGKGGLFPLRYPAEDQRNVEIWYQMNAYVIENFF
jgi:hypothetical protein